MAKFNNRAVRFLADKQKQSYYTPPFYQTPSLEHSNVEEGSHFANDISALSQKVEILEHYIEAGDLVVWVNHCSIYASLEILKKNKYESLTEMSAIDFIEQKGGFELFYQLICFERHTRLRVKSFIPVGTKIESVCSLYKSADWSEREMYDMFGIYINHHPNMKRILMPDDWLGHPLLKTYPLHGDEAAQWYEVDKIFGKEYREVVGAENRDPALIERYDTTRFGRIGYEVPYGEDNTKEEKPTPIHYQEEGGVALVKRLKPEESRQLTERK
ncbi:NADH-quinone oxidoreductase subunit C [Helicobacter monodelphidis]|uniref:NADH-quinone oxidoreductase subunit C n=1 Tax=Helicobacter sp. 15-1451 TaxID=2004995 RepID=UPI000DCB31D6|nr:NADH-quinone oxidoreductase subunit C [Helicobacter sp. 15-1451]RAX59293.1 NADH-quinone oxidoreductase subunit C [Helicobacter sp. 15-1451]